MDNNPNMSDRAASSLLYIYILFARILSRYRAANSKANLASNVRDIRLTLRVFCQRICYVGHF